MMVRLLQYGQERSRPKRKGKWKNKGNGNFMHSIRSWGYGFDVTTPPSRDKFPECGIVRFKN
jgi:hypothetical protein